MAVQGFVLREVLFSNNRWDVIVCLAFFGERSGLKGLAVRWGSAGLGLRGLRRLLKGWGFRAVREGGGLFASKARFGRIPLPPGQWCRLGDGAGCPS